MLFRSEKKETLDDLLNRWFPKAPAAETPAERSQLPQDARAQIIDIENSYNNGEINQEEATQRIRDVVMQSSTAGATESEQAVDIQTEEETAKGSTQTIVTSGSPPTTQQQDSSTRKFIDGFGESLSDYKELTKERIQAIKDFLNVEDLKDRYLRSTWYSLVSLPQQVELFAKELPSLRGLLNTILTRAAELKARKEIINKNLRKWTAAIKKFDRKTIKEFYYVGNESTRTQVDFKSTDPEQVRNPLRARFYALPKELQDVYWDMLAAYRKMSDEYVNLISKVLSPTAANELRQAIEKNRLKVYFPLYRDGEYMLRYAVPSKNGKGQETVVQFFRSSGARKRAWAEAKANGAVSPQFYSGVDEVFEKGEAGQFFTKTMEELDAQNAPESIKRALYELYLDQLPASSVRQMYRKRNGYAGAESDMINVYATVASRMMNQLNNLQFRPDMDAALKAVDDDYKKYSAENEGNLAVKRLKSNLNIRMERIQNADNSGFLNALANFGGSTAYRFYILGNISTALTNLTQLGVAYAVLEGKYRGKAGDAMQNAVSQYFKGGFDKSDEDPTRLHFADWSFGIGLEPGSNLEKLYNTAIQQGAIRRSIGYEAIEGRKRRLSQKDYMGKMARADKILSWVFQNSERMNREVTLLAAYDLEFANNGGNVEQAIQSAIDAVEIGRAHV